MGSAMVRKQRQKGGNSSFLCPFATGRKSSDSLFSMSVDLLQDHLRSCYPHNYFKCILLDLLMTFLWALSKAPPYYSPLQGFRPCPTLAAISYLQMTGDQLVKSPHWSNIARRARGKTSKPLKKQQRRPFLLVLWPFIGQCQPAPANNLKLV